MKALEIIVQLKEAQEKKEKIEYTIKQLFSYYFKKATITIKIDSGDYNHDKQDRHFEVDKKVFINYLEKENIVVKDEISQLMDQFMSLKEE